MKNKYEVFNKLKEFKALIKNHTERRARLFYQTTAENSLQMSSRNNVKTQGLRGSSTLPIIRNRMALQNERT